MFTLWYNFGTFFMLLIACKIDQEEREERKWWGPELDSKHKCPPYCTCRTHCIWERR